MKNLLFILIPAIILIILGAVGFTFYQSGRPIAEIRGQKFQLTVAKSEKDKQIGLSNHKNLPKDRGMLFIFEKPGTYPFWMKDMKFPIDIIFINTDKIVTIHKNLKTNDLTIYTSTQSADKVLEINANLSDKYGFQVGDSVTFRNIR